MFVGLLIVALEGEILSSIHISRIVDLVKHVVWESAETFGYIVDVKVMDYIAKGTFRVPSYTLNLIIRFRNHGVHM